MSQTADPLTPEVVARIRAGERDAFERLFRAWYPRLADHAFRLVASRDVAEDVVQEVFVAVWRNRASLPEEGRLAAYLHRAVRNRSMNAMRRDRTAQAWVARQGAPEEVPAVAELRLEQADLRRALRDALAALSPRAREVFLLSRDGGLTYPAIAETLGISVKTVEMLMGRALKTLRERLAPGGPEAGVRG